MGQKVNPIGFRIGVYTTWPSRWYARGASYADLLAQDQKIRTFIKKALRNAEIGQIEIEMAGDVVRVVLHSARPGMAIGKKGQEIEGLRRNLRALLGREVEVSVQEIKEPLLSAQVVAQQIADQLERRASFKKVCRKAATDILRAGAKGTKIRVAGRLDGAEIARDEWVRMGSVPLHTLRANIDYGFAEALTTYGLIGVKVWICKGDYNKS